MKVILYNKYCQIVGENRQIKIVFMLTKIFKELNLPENASRIYMRLLEVGSATARSLAENLGIPRPSVYDNLKILIKNGLAVEREEENKKVFQADDIRNLPLLAEAKINSLKKEVKEIKKILPKISQQVRVIEPRIKFYQGAEGIKQVLKDLLWYENIETLTMWPISEMVEILDKEYLADLNRKRIRQNISIRGIWPQDKIVDLKEYPFLGVGKKHLRQLRLAPKEMTWEISYWQYADKVAFISSKREGFGFVIHSQDFANLIKAQFEVIWKLSRPIKSQPQYTDEFLKTV